MGRLSLRYVYLHKPIYSGNVILTVSTVQSPTGSDYSGVAEVKDTEPWKEGGSAGKFKYYVNGDPRQGVKDHPSALNSVIIPNVTLPKVRGFSLSLI